MRKTLLIIAAAFAVCLVSCTKTSEVETNIYYTAIIDSLSCTAGHEADTVAFGKAIDNIIANIKKDVLKTDDEVKKACEDTCKAYDGKYINAILFLFKSVNEGKNEQIGKWYVKAASQPEPEPATTEYEIGGNISVMESYSAMYDATMSKDMDALVKEIGKSLTTEDQIKAEFKKLADKYRNRFVEGVLELVKTVGTEKSTTVDTAKLAFGKVSYTHSSEIRSIGGKPGEDAGAALEESIKKIESVFGSNADSLITRDAKADFDLHFNAKFLNGYAVFSKFINGKDSVSVLDYSFYSACYPDVSEIKTTQTKDPKELETALEEILVFLDEAFFSVEEIITGIVKITDIETRQKAIPEFVKNAGISEKLTESGIWKKYGIPDTEHLYFYATIMDSETGLLKKEKAWTYPEN